MKKQRHKQFDDGHTCAIEGVNEGSSDGRADMIYVVWDGQRIAYRGLPGTPQARTWVSMVPGYEVTDDFTDDGRTLSVYVDGKRLH
jgi:hypothetical protein